MQDNFLNKLVKCVSPSALAIATALIIHSVISDWRTKVTIQEEITKMKVKQEYNESEHKEFKARFIELEKRP